MTNPIFLVKAGLPNEVPDSYCTQRMRDQEAWCRHAAEAIVTVLSDKAIVRLRTEKKAVTDKIAAALLDNFRQEAALEHEAERLADEHLRTARGLDRHKVLQLIKQRLAEEKKFVL